MHRLKKLSLIAGVLALCLVFTSIGAGAKSYKTKKNKKGYAIASGYDYGKPVPKADTQPLGYMNDAAVFGDSRTEGLYLYTDLKDTKAQKYCDIGLNCETVLTKKFKTVSGKKATAIQHLKANKKSINKVYFLFGLNELGWSETTFIKNYKKLIVTVRDIIPDAIIYVGEIIPVTKSKDLTDKVHNNWKVRSFNRELKKLCEQEQIFFIETYPLMTDGEGNLPEGISSDGIHFGSTFTKKWLNLLLSRTVELKK